MKALIFLWVHKLHSLHTSAYHFSLWAGGQLFTGFSVSFLFLPIDDGIPAGLRKHQELCL